MENKTRGKFIVLEGMDGSGKGEAMSGLKEGLDPSLFLFTEEPAGTSLGVDIKKLLHEHRVDEMSVLAELLLFYAARAEHLEKKIKPALLSGKHVICDRFSLSTLAYQIYARQRADYIDEFKILDQLVVGNFRPDLYILLDVEPEVGMTRTKNRSAELSRFDAKDLEFHRMVRLGYISNISKYGGKVVDTSEISIPEVRREVLSEIKKYLKID